MIVTEEALPGRDTAIPVVARHLVLGTPITPPFPEGLERIVVGMDCFWGADEAFEFVSPTHRGQIPRLTQSPSWRAADQDRLR